MTISEQLECIGNGIDPMTGEIFDILSLSSDPVARNAILRLYGIVMPDARRKKPQPANRLNRPVEEIFQKLKDWRLNTASVIGMPPYVIFTNEELYNIAAGDVVEMTDLLMCKGVGAKKFELYGKDVYDILREYI